MPRLPVGVFVSLLRQQDEDPSPDHPRPATPYAILCGAGDKAQRVVCAGQTLLSHMPSPWLVSINSPVARVGLEFKTVLL